LPRGTNSRLNDRSTDTGVAWSADGERIVFAGRDGVYERVLNAAAGQQMLLPSAGQELMVVYDWSRDGRFILYATVNSGTGRRELSALPLDGDRKPLTIGTVGSEFRFSPDGRWFAYVSDESGRNEIYVRRFDPFSKSGSTEAGTPYTIVSKGNVAVMLGWRDDGRELWYVTPDSSVMSVVLRLDRTVEVGQTMPLFQLPAGVGVGQGGDRAAIDRRRSLSDRRPDQTQHAGAVHRGPELAGLDARLIQACRGARKAAPRTSSAAR